MKGEISYGDVLKRVDIDYILSNKNDRNSFYSFVCLASMRYEKINDFSIKGAEEGRYLANIRGIKKIYGYKTIDNGFYDTYNELYLSSEILDLVESSSGINIGIETGIIKRDKSLVIPHSYVTFNRVLEIPNQSKCYGYETIDHEFYDTYNEVLYDREYLKLINAQILNQQGFIPIYKRDSQIHEFIRRSKESIHSTYKKIKEII